MLHIVQKDLRSFMDVYFESMDILTFVRSGKFMGVRLV